MTARELGRQVQGFFDSIRDFLEPIDNRWTVLAAAFLVILVCRGFGLASLSNLIAMFYVMYFVTLRSTDRSE